MTGAVPLSPLDLALAALFVGTAGVVSLALRLGMAGRLALAAGRAVVQLLAVGLVLRWVFALEHPGILALVLLVMILAAAQAAVARPRRRVKSGGVLTFLALSSVGLFTTLTTTAVIIEVEPWYAPRYVIPLLGMVLGNGLTGISLVLDDLLDAFSAGKGAIEEALALGATAWEASRAPVAAAVRRGLVPIVNSMSVVGVVSLPGMMTGQILAGADPMRAVQYQLVVMFMIAGSTTLGALLVALLVFRRVFDAEHRIRADAITDERKQS
jgi:putative ABC transport system permease protein